MFFVCLGVGFCFNVSYSSGNAGKKILDGPGGDSVDIKKQWQEARANRRMQFKVGNYRVLLFCFFFVFALCCRFLAFHFDRVV